MKKKIKIVAQEKNYVCMFGEMTNASALSEKKPRFRQKIIGLSWRF